MIETPVREGTTSLSSASAAVSLSAPDPAVKDAHRESVNCPCRPEKRRALGGGEVTVHRIMVEGRATVEDRAPDRLCGLCGQWHFVGHDHLIRRTAIGKQFTERITAAGVPADDATVAYLVEQLV